ncbi:hypothetical protein RFI_09303 [Reticulomyxa filosa]|uniref:PARG catalytic Macro domain-containing protein n=1 Tax=Reticulomyxa filosa TaxID=46433 RepID=X6NQ39_RETFI|nr:hypothetical protein RFI_09303 [Reticulomyxa filosa]|eukprot:ETO27829.1 hypothetical protein RFI_09303 [Reticulomyxa filosa]
MAQDELCKKQWSSMQPSDKNLNSNGNGTDKDHSTTRSLLIHRHKVPPKVTEYLTSDDGLLTNQSGLCPVHVLVDGKIEDSAGDIQIDFANKRIGGGVFSRGCVQEVVCVSNNIIQICICTLSFFFFLIEIRFVINPECLVSLLLCEEMRHNEIIAIVGTKQYSQYQGYGNTFEYLTHHDDQTTSQIVNKDLNCVRTCNCIVAIDAERYHARNEHEQFSLSKLRRDLIKCYAGFSVPATISHFWFVNNEITSLHSDSKYDEDADFINIATGNWGCGVFRGNVELKFVIQWLAASLCGCEEIKNIICSDKDKDNPQKERRRALKYYTFADSKCKYIESFVKLCIKNELKIHDLWKHVFSYCEWYRQNLSSVIAKKDNAPEKDEEIWIKTAKGWEASLFRFVAKHYEKGLEELTPHPSLVEEFEWKIDEGSGFFSDSVEPDQQCLPEPQKCSSMHLGIVSIKEDGELEQENHNSNGSDNPSG